MQVADHDVYPEDPLNDLLVKNDKEYAKAYVKGIVIMQLFPVSYLV